jgi:hypothetical protein
VECLDRECSTRDCEAGRTPIELGELRLCQLQCALKWNSEQTFSAFMVADVTISFKSRRRESTVEVIL